MWNSILFGNWVNLLNLVTLNNPLATYEYLWKKFTNCTAHYIYFPYPAVGTSEGSAFKASC